jgi:hypothetical protein
MLLLKIYSFFIQHDVKARSSMRRAESIVHLFETLGIDILNVKAFKLINTKNFHKISEDIA